MSDADQYRAKASQAERLGLAMSTLVNRDQLLEIARGWRDLAERLEAEYGQANRLEGAH